MQYLSQDILFYIIGMLIIAGIALQGVLIGATYRPFPVLEYEAEDDEEEEEVYTEEDHQNNNKADIILKDKIVKPKEDKIDANNNEMLDNVSLESGGSYTEDVGTRKWIDLSVLKNVPFIFFSLSTFLCLIGKLLRLWLKQKFKYIELSVNIGRIPQSL